MYNNNEISLTEATVLALQGKLKLEETKPIKVTKRKVEANSNDDRLSKLRDKVWEYMLNDTHRLEDFTDLEFTEDTTDEIYSTAMNNLGKFNVHQLQQMINQINKNNIDLVKWGHKVLGDKKSKTESVGIDTDNVTVAVDDNGNTTVETEKEVITVTEKDDTVEDIIPTEEPVEEIIDSEETIDVPVEGDETILPEEEVSDEVIDEIVDEPIEDDLEESKKVCEVCENCEEGKCGKSNKIEEKMDIPSGFPIFELKLDTSKFIEEDENGNTFVKPEYEKYGFSDEIDKITKGVLSEIIPTLTYTDEGDITFNNEKIGEYCFGYEGVVDLDAYKNYKKENKCEENKECLTEESVKYEWILQGNYGYGWDDLVTYDNKEEAERDYKDYRENEPEYAHRIRKRVVKEEVKDLTENVTIEVADDGKEIEVITDNAENVDVVDTTEEPKTSDEAEEVTTDIEDIEDIELDESKSVKKEVKQTFNKQSFEEVLTKFYNFNNENVKSFKIESIMMSKSGALKIEGKLNDKVDTTMVFDKKIEGKSFITYSLRKSNVLKESKDVRTTMTLNKISNTLKCKNIISK